MLNIMAALVFWH